MDDKKKKLFDAAHVLFLERGFKDTGISDISGLADVAVGSFYLYFQSKEDVFSQVYNRENEEIKRLILEKVSLDDDPVKLIHEVINRIFKLSTNNAILKDWFLNQKNISSQNEMAVQDSLIYSILSKLIDRWVLQDKINSDMTKVRIIGLFDALIVINSHKKEIETEDFDQVLDDMITGVLRVVLK
ncbi:TetR/AcrR family transcriptional regulator [Companilactobacillus keshanensis]|uniref:TetR/AcrR family transcriptional regulator n=1 Tax=Companilactobacillus keshanensis TaxID=2486003 RepID=A0ABW4BUG5_9LACO|nr:TetR/AcrR family transcriptional regulator [Companilactobacillus keshanensis]